VPVQVTSRGLCITEPYGGSDVAGMRTTAVRKGINMLSMDQNIYYEWCLCGLLYCCHKNKTRYSNKRDKCNRLKYHRSFCNEIR
jgi:hypothetical protein